MTQAVIWTRSHWVDAAHLAAHIDEDDVPAEASGQSLHDWHRRLCDDGLLHKAVMFLAHALPRYECVVWGAQALLEMGAADRLDPIMVAVLRWIDQPSDALRREAGELAESSRRRTPARSLGQAVMYSGGSIAPPEYAALLPPDGACALMVGGAVLAGAALEGDYSSRVRDALAKGEAMARGV